MPVIKFIKLVTHTLSLYKYDSKKGYRSNVFSIEKPIVF